MVRRADGPSVRNARARKQLRRGPLPGATTTLSDRTPYPSALCIGVGQGLALVLER
ncbi:hypothetical protein [Streptomyces sp. NPDC004266]|uniref:hypothetical protein n=1 Tax=Streptomyces sp. NPDC004266 TaxID=3364693 RepID=UPI003695864D